MEQTAVEFLFAHLLPFLDWSKREDRIKFRQLEQEALNIEKQQIEDAHIEGQRVFDKHPHTQWTNDQAEQYYTSTYGSKGSETKQ